VTSPDSGRVSPTAIDERAIAAAERAARSRSPWRTLGHEARGRLRVTLNAWLAFVPPVIVILAFVLGSAWAPPTARRSFFEASAQVIPVLLLALAVESRYLRVRRARPIPPLLWDLRELLTVMGAGLAPEERAVWEARIADLSTSAETRRYMRVNAFFAGVWKWGSVVQRQLTAVLSAALVVLFLGLAEWTCLEALAAMDDDTATREPSLVMGAILAGLVGVGVIALFGPGGREPEAPSPPRAG
jgi:hypothetical protein